MSIEIKVLLNKDSVRQYFNSQLTEDEYDRLEKNLEGTHRPITLFGIQGMAIENQRHWG